MINSILWAVKLSAGFSYQADAKSLIFLCPDKLFLRAFRLFMQKFAPNQTITVVDFEAHCRMLG